MRKLFLAATGLFWLAIMAFTVAGRLTAPEPSTSATAPASQALVKQAATHPGKRYALAELARHAVEADCWMAIDGVVYDLTAYLPEHPSRPSIIVPWCGKEASDAYKTKTKGRPHSPEADQLLPTYRIGTLVKP